MRKVPIPLVGRGLLRAYLIIFRRDVDENQVGVIAWAEAMYAFFFVGFLFTVMRGLVGVWPFKGPVVLPTMMVMTVFTLWWLARYNEQVSATGSLSSRSAKRGFTGYAALFWQTWMTQRCQKGLDEWNILLVREPLMLCVPAVVLCLLWLPAAGLLLFAVALCGSLQSIRDRAIDREEREEQDKLSRDQVALMGDAPDVIDAEDDDPDYYMQYRIHPEPFIDENGEERIGVMAADQVFIRNEKFKPPIARGTSSAPVMIWPSIVTTIIVTGSCLNFAAGDLLGLYRVAPARFAAAAVSLDRELAVLGLNPGDSSHPGLHDTLLQELDPEAWADQQTREALLQAQARLAAEEQSLAQQVRDLRSRCEALPGEVELAPGPASFHAVLLENRSVAGDWAVIVRGLPQAEADFAAVQRAILDFERSVYADATQVAAAEAEAKQQLHVVSQELTALQAAQQRVALAIRG